MVVVVVWLQFGEWKISTVAFGDCLQPHDKHSAERRRHNTAVVKLDPLLERSEGDQHYAEGHRRPDEQYTV